MEKTFACSCGNACGGLGVSENKQYGTTTSVELSFKPSPYYHKIMSRAHAILHIIRYGAPQTEAVVLDKTRFESFKQYINSIKVGEYL